MKSLKRQLARLAIQITGRVVVWIQKCFPYLQILCIRKVFGCFLIYLIKHVIFGAFFMQRMCNLCELAKDKGPI